MAPGRSVGCSEWEGKGEQRAAKRRGDSYWMYVCMYVCCVGWIYGQICNHVIMFGLGVGMGMENILYVV